MAEKTLQELYAEKVNNFENEEAQKRHQQIAALTERELRLREYYETSKIADIPENVISNNFFDYKKAERIFEKAISLISPDVWRTHQNVSVEDGEVGSYDSYIGYKYTLKVDMVFKGTRKEKHFGLEVPTAIPVKFEPSIYFKPISPFSKGKPEKLPVRKLPEAEINLVMPANSRIEKARSQSVGTQEFVTLRFIGETDNYTHRYTVYLFRDGVVTGLDYRVWNVWTGKRSEDEIAVDIAFAVNTPKTPPISVRTEYYRDKALF